MKNIVKKENIMKGAGVLLIVLVLLFSNLSVMANTTMDTLKQNIQTNESSYVSSMVFGQEYEILLEENFTDGNIPPTGDWGVWDLIQTNQNETWYIDSTIPHSSPYCGTVHRGSELDILDEWLITPSLDFSIYSNIYLEFYWYADWWTSQVANITNFNVSISTDGGSTWDLIWSEDYLTGGFPTWEWIYTNDGNWIDLSDYADETDVKIGFQYYSNSTEQPQAQEFSIDDIKVLADTEEFRGHHHGPYEWWWPVQYDYLIPGVRFHGSAEGGKTPYHYYWDFGDGNSSTLKDPIHLYEDLGTFNVTLRVEDSSNPPRITVNETYANLFLLPPPDIDIQIRLISFGIKVDIENPGEYNATYVNWTMVVHWAPLQIREKLVANGTIDRLAPDGTELIESGYFFAFGRIHITISVHPENLRGLIKHFNAFKIGPFVFVYNAG